MPKVSVILPTYNRANVILRSIESVLNQSFRDLELIVIDDCSTDNTKDVLNKISDPRLKSVFLKKNKGACYARNVGIKKAQGNFIAFQDSGDEWLHGKLEKQINYLEEKKIDAVCSSYILVENSSVVKKIPPGKHYDFFIKCEDLLPGNLVGTPTLIVKASLIREIGGFDDNLPRFQDWELAIRIAQKTPIFFYSEPLTIAHACQDSLTANNFNGVIALEHILKKHCVMFKKNRKEFAMKLRFLAKNYYHFKCFKKAWFYGIRSIKMNPESLKFLFVRVFRKTYISKQN